MKRAAILACVLLSAACSGTAQTYHDAAYLVGGYESPSPSSRIVPGTWVVRGDGSASTVALHGGYSWGFSMDLDNRHVVVTSGSNFSAVKNPPMYGLYRFDPNTLAYTTIYGPDTVNCYSMYKLLINQDGDYIFNNWTRTWTGSTCTRNYQLMKVTQGGTLSTLFTTVALGRQAKLNGTIETNIDTGNILVSELNFQGPNFFPVLEVASDGRTVNSWNSSAYGWYGYYSMPQDYRTGYLYGPHDDHVYLLRPGPASRSTLFTLSTKMHFNCSFDLQSAPTQRWVNTPYTSSPVSSWISCIDTRGIETSIKVNIPGKQVAWYDFDFYRGSHLRTMLTTPNRWNILLSCPRSPKLSYGIAAGYSGIRPGIKLADGRTVLLNYDVLVFLTLHGLLPGIWNGGPGTLDASGNATASMNLTSLSRPPGGFGIPIWIAMVVIDPRSPGGIKYIPDPIVFRL